MKLHLPVLLRKAVLTCFSVVSVCTLYSGGIVAAADLTLAEADSLVVDYADSSSITDLSGGTLALAGGTELLLKNCGEGDGKTYTLLTGVSSLLDAEGNPLTLTDENNAALLYFDTTQPGTGFWGGGWLQLTSEGHVQLVLHGGEVQEALTISTRQTGSKTYNYYEGICFRDITYMVSSYSSPAYGGAIYGDNIELNNNGSVEFTGNSASGSFVYGGAIYGRGDIVLSNNGGVTFSGNSASYGGAIYGGENSTITLSNNGSVEFSGNSASSDGGAICTYGSVTMSGNGSVTFSGNSASSDGGAIYGYPSSTISLSDNGSVTFSGNSASSDGGAIYGRGGDITLSNNGSVTFSGNSASSSYGAYGGAIYGRGGDITLSNNGSVTFSGNSASSSDGAYGGAIYYTGVSLHIRNNDSVLFEKNAEVRNGTYRLRGVYADGFGDVISLSAAAGKSIEFRDSVYISSDTTPNLNADYTDAVGVGHKQMGDIIFTGKYAETHLNEILAADEQSRTATAVEILNSRTTTVYAMTNLYGGRLRVEDGAIYQGYGITVHEDSAATVRVQNATLNHSGYDLTFNSGTTLELTGNNTISGDVRMLENSTLLLNVGDTVGCTDINGNLDIAGGMTLSDSGSSSIENGVLMYVAGDLKGWTEDTWVGSSANDHVSWLGNLLVLNYNESTFNLYFNGTASYNTWQKDKALWHHYQALTFEKCCGNDAFALGGAIYGNSSSTISLSDNGSVTFSGNTTDYGGAIYTNGSLCIQNNDSVLFEKNAEVRNGTYRLRGVYAEYDGGFGDVISLSSAAGKSIEFRDSVFIASDSTLNLNADFGEVKQQGDIIFTGKYVETHLNEILAADEQGRTATAEEILNSRTTVVEAMTNLYGGRLRVEDGAIYQGRGIMVHEGSVATVLVKDATLSHSGYDLIFNAGTTLELVGDSQLAGNLMMLSGSILSLDSTMNLNGSLTLGNEVVLGGSLLDDILSMKAGDTLTLVSGLESLHLQTQSLMRSLEYTTLLSGELVNASDYFVNLKGYSDLVFSYDSNTQTLKMIYAIPEPTTTTLSLLALAALAARRRRK